MIYADNAATTKPSETALNQALAFWRDEYGNASSRHSLGTKARRAVEKARRDVAEALGAESDEIFFTSGGSEGNALVWNAATGEAATSTIEHESVFQSSRAFVNRGGSVVYASVGSDGVVSLETLKRTLRPTTRFVSIMAVNNEIGTIQPIAEIGRFLRSRGVLFHSDAVQAVGRIPVDVKTLNVDFLTASAHKFNGVKGVGILYKRRGVALEPAIRGGGQEGGLRAGTENVGGVVAAACALAENVAAMKETNERLQALENTTLKRLRERTPPNAFKVVAETTRRVPGFFSLVFDGANGEALTQLADLKGVCVSPGAACSSGRSEPSRVLTALGASEREAKSAVRVSFGRFNLERDAEAVADALAFAYRKIVAAKRLARE